MCCRRKGGHLVCRGCRSVSRADGFTEQVWGRGGHWCEEDRCSGLQWSGNDSQTQELLQVKRVPHPPSASLLLLYISLWIKGVLSLYCRSIKRKKFDDELVESSLAKSTSRVKGQPVIEPIRCPGSDLASSDKKKVMKVTVCHYITLRNIWLWLIVSFSGQASLTV